MYGINNNTGMTYSQQNNNLAKLNRKINNTQTGQKIAKEISSGIEALNGLQSESGWERLKAGTKLAMAIYGKI